MAKQLIRYLLEGDGTVPVFVEDGGYYCNTVTDELVGRSVDETVRNLPSTVYRLTRAELKTRIKNQSQDYFSLGGAQMTDGELDTHIQAFLDHIGLGDLA